MPTKKHLDGVSGCQTYGGALPGRCMGVDQCQNMLQRGGDGWVASTELLSGHAAAWFLDARGWSSA